MLETSETDIHGKNDSGLGQGGRRGLRLEEGHWCGWGVLGWVGGDWWLPERQTIRGDPVIPGHPHIL